MKKIISFLASFCTVLFFAQSGPGTMFVYNFSNYKVDITFVGNSDTANCLPSLSGTMDTPLMPNDAVKYLEYFGSGYMNPSISKWETTLVSGQSNSTPTYHTSQLLQSPPITNNVKWALAKFNVNLPNGGFSIGKFGCGANSYLINYVGGNSIPQPPTGTYPIEAFWFVASGDTYFVIQ
jgi:hypothetical protein